LMHWRKRCRLVFGSLSHWLPGVSSDEEKYVAYDAVMSISCKERWQ
jgi:hypothetical protein